MDEAGREVLSPMSTACPGCGLVTPGGATGCQALVEELWARDFSNAAYFPSHRMLVDAYCLQHPDRYCASAKSLAAHLGGLCCAFDHGEDPTALPALQRWLNGDPTLTKPEIHASRGPLTVANVHGAPDAAAHACAVREWARSTWGAYASLHDVARAWVRQALEAGSVDRRGKRRPT